MRTLTLVKILAAACLMFSGVLSTAIAEVSGKDAPTVALNFVTQIQAGDAGTAYLQIASHYPKNGEELSFEVDAAQNHIDDRPVEWGDPIGVEEYQTNKTSRLRNYSYLLMYENHAEIWTVQFYKNTLGSKWMINDIQYAPLANAFNH